MKYVFVLLFFIPVMAYADQGSFIIQPVNGGAWAINGTNGNIDFANSDSESVIQAALWNLPHGGTVFVQSGFWNITRTLVIPGNVNLIGEGINKTVYQRNLDSKEFAIYLGYGNNSIFSNFSFDGNYLKNTHNVNGTGMQDGSDIYVAGNNDIVSNFKSYNYSREAIKTDGKNNLIEDCTMTGPKNYSQQAYGILSAYTSTILLIQNCNINGNHLSAIYMGGNSVFVDNTVSENHYQTYPTGGGQIAADGDRNIFSAMYNNTVGKGGGFVTDGLEVGQHKALLARNHISNNQNGISIDLNSPVLEYQNTITNSSRMCLNNQGFNQVININNICQ